MSETKKTSAELFAFLDSLSIPYENHEHEAVFTVAESEALREDLSGGHTKNLFLKDKKSRYFLLTVGQHAKVNLKTVHEKIGAQGRVSFGSADALMDMLGVAPGSITAFGVINDTDKKITLIFDAALMENETIHAHPLRNTATTAIGREDLKRFVEATGHQVRIEALCEG